MLTAPPAVENNSLRWVALAIAAIASASATGLRSDYAASWNMWVTLLVPYVLLGALSIRWLKLNGSLGQSFRLKSGDTSIGILVGLLMVAVAFIALTSLVREGSPSSAWLFRIHLQLGDVQAFGPRLATLLSLVVLEEIVWRGMVLQLLTARFGARPAVPLTAVAYALAQLPTVFTLHVPGVGTNPLVLVSAALAGLCWSFLAQRLNRLLPVILAHAVFSYFLAGPMPQIP